MRWSLHRWVWKLEAPLFIGMPPAGALARCRLYVPARAMWGALTAELTRRNAAALPVDYRNTGEEIREHTRVTYLFPAERQSGSWLAWLPDYVEGAGLCWRRENQRGSGIQAVPDRQFRRRLVDARPGTAIDPRSDSAEEATLRETECMLTRWRVRTPQPDNEVALVGYVLLNDGHEFGLEGIETLFLGGDTRYGLGYVRIVERQPAVDVFGVKVVCGEGEPHVETEKALAHTKQADEAHAMRGALEWIVGWDRVGPVGPTTAGHSPLWAPGSSTSDPRHKGWHITADGSWEGVL